MCAGENRDGKPCGKRARADGYCHWHCERPTAISSVEPPEPRVWTAESILEVLRDFVETAPRTKIQESGWTRIYLHIGGAAAICTILALSASVAFQVQELMDSQSRLRIEKASKLVDNAWDLLEREAGMPGQIQITAPSQKQVNYELARDLIEDALADAPTLSTAYHALGTLDYLEGHLDKAKFNLERAIDLDPDSAEAHSSLGAVLQQQNKPIKAKKSFLLAIEHNAAFPGARIYLGLLYQHQGEYDKALQEFQRATGVDSNPRRSSIAYTYLGYHHLLRNPRSSKAAENFRKAARNDPENAKYHVNLGMALQRLNRLAEARKSYEKALGLQPESPRILNYLALLHLEQDELDEAESRFQEAVDADPDLALTHNNRGLLFIELRRLEEAEESFRRALQLAPDNTEAESNLDCLLRIVTNAEKGLQGRNEPISFGSGASCRNKLAPSAPERVPPGPH